ncbi:MAG: hypothetical protein ACRCXC_10845 [Legionella sp.]
MALFIWMIYMVMSSYNLWLILFKQLKLHTGIILLPTVATQSVVLITYSLFANTLPSLLYQTLIVLGYFFYAIGLFLILTRTFVYPHHTIILSWHHTNSIIHGALSISGLASVSTHALNDTVIISTWFLATGFLILNEGISVIKGIYRLKLSGFFKA